MSKNTTLILSITALGAAYMLNRAANRKIMQMKATLAQHEAVNTQTNLRSREAAREQAMQQMRQFEDMFGPELSERLYAHARDFRRGTGV